MQELNPVLFLTDLAVLALCGALAAILPALTRKSYLFGVKIPMEERGSPAARHIIRRYVAACLLAFAAVLALHAAQYLLAPGKTAVSMLYFPLLFGAAQLLAFLPAWKAALRLKRERGWQVSGAAFAETSSSSARGNLRALPWGWYAASLAVVAACAAATLVKYPSLPEVIPTHFDINMEPDAWSPKSLGTVLAVPLVNLGTLLLMFVTGIAIVRAKLQIDPQRPALSFAQHRIYRRLMGHALGFLTLAITAMMALAGLPMVFPEFKAPFWLTLLLTLLPVAALIAVVVYAGQGGCKLKPKVTEEGGPAPAGKNGVPGRGDDQSWALGMFYHNREDPAVLVEDRFGSNLGFNYARLPVKIGVAAFLLAFAAGYAWLTVLLWNVG
ncbi:MAG: DUF1648 domain-containing protein [Oscillospiraceae bacterium]|nr:DUF1648 domain-containing protein [Oscillospiraceae bacterium]